MSPAARFTDAPCGRYCSAIDGHERDGGAMISRLEQGSLVTVFGGSGFLGRHAVRALAADGWRVRAAVRRPDLAGHLQPMGAVGQIHAVQANVRFPDSVRRAVEGAHAVVNLVGILAKSGRQTFEAVHVEGARAIAEAARAAGASTLVHVSAIGADKACEGQLRAHQVRPARRPCCERFPDAVILRPSLVFGPEDQLFNRFAALAGFSPFLPLIGGGQHQAAAGLRRRRGAPRSRPPAPARRGRARSTSWAAPRSSPSASCSTGPWRGRGASATICACPSGRPSSARSSPLPLPNSLRPLTVDQVRMLQVDNVVSKAAEAEGRTLAGLGIAQPHTMEAVVPGYLERFQPHGQFAHYRG